MARGSRIWPSANAACSRTSGRVLERDDERFDGARGADLAEREGRLLARVCRGILQGRDQRLDSARIANLPEREDRLFADVGIGVAQAPRRARRPRSGRAAVRARRRPAREPRRRCPSARAMSGSTARLSRIWPRPNTALPANIRRGILQRLDERFEDARVAHLHERVHRRLTHFLVRILERGSQRGDELRIGLRLCSPALLSSSCRAPPGVRHGRREHVLQRHLDGALQCLCIAHLNRALPRPESLPAAGSAALARPARPSLAA